ncbi:MAG: hypothetical protein U0892_19255 [Pirellulales bacterium]
MHGAWPPSYEEFAYRIELWGDEIEQISIINPLTGRRCRSRCASFIRPSTSSRRIASNEPSR